MPQVQESPPTTTVAQNGYIAFYNRQRHELYAPSLYEAKLQAIAHFKAPKSKEHMISVMLAEKDGQPVVHVAVD